MNLCLVWFANFFLSLHAPTTCVEGLIILSIYFLIFGIFQMIKNSSIGSFIG